jgi:hypothetical protein
VRILVRSPEQKQWEFANPVSPKAEVEIQALLLESPSLIPADDIREGLSPFVVAVGEFGLPGSGSTDVLAFTPDGDVALVECKLAANQEIKRKVIGQILEYAAFLWGMGYEELAQRVQAKHKKPLEDLVADAVADDLDRDAFRRSLEQSLTSGSFILVIVVDEINEELARIIRFVNECAETRFSLHALELRKFMSGNLEVLVPHLHGVSRRQVSPPSHRKRWTEAGYWAAVDVSVDARAQKIMRNLFEWTQHTADRVWFGTGAGSGSFTFHFLRGNAALSVYSVFTTGKLVLNYGWLSRVVDEKCVGEFHERLTAIHGFHEIPADFKKWPSVMVADAFKSHEDLEHFKEAVQWFGERNR